MNDEQLGILNDLSQALNQIVVGQTALVQQLMVALLSGGHVILEGVPGTGKTLLVKLLAQLVRAEFRRVQLTPDILPSDIIGTNIFDLNTRRFALKKRPSIHRSFAGRRNQSHSPKDSIGIARSHGRTASNVRWRKFASTRTILGNCHSKSFGI